MKTLIVYSSKYGATEECAARIAARLRGGADLHGLDGAPDIDIAPYDCVVLGTSFYLGRPRRAMRSFARANLNPLLQKQIGLYLCCIQDLSKTVGEQFRLAYPKSLMEHATVLGQLGGKVDFTKLKPFDRFIMNMIAGDLRKKTGGDVISTISQERIDRFCELLEAGKQEAERIVLAPQPQGTESR